MSARALKPVVPLSYQRKQAAEALGVSPDFFDKHVATRVPCRYVGDLRLWLVTDLQAFLHRLPDRATAVLS